MIINSSVKILSHLLLDPELNSSKSQNCCSPMYLKCVNHLCLVTTSEAEFREVEMLCVFPFGGAIYKWTEDIVAIVNVTAVNTYQC